MRDPIAAAGFGGWLHPSVVLAIRPDTVNHVAFRQLLVTKWCAVGRVERHGRQKMQLSSAPLVGRPARCRARNRPFTSCVRRNRKQTRLPINPKASSATPVTTTRRVRRMRSSSIRRIQCRVLKAIDCLGKQYFQSEMWSAGVAAAIFSVWPETSGRKAGRPFDARLCGRTHSSSLRG